MFNRLDHIGIVGRMLWEELCPRGLKWPSRFPEDVGDMSSCILPSPKNVDSISCFCAACRPTSQGWRGKRASQAIVVGSNPIARYIPCLTRPRASFSSYRSGGERITPQVFFLVLVQTPSPHFVRTGGSSGDASLHYYRRRKTHQVFICTECRMSNVL